MEKFFLLQDEMLSELYEAGGLNLARVKVSNPFTKWLKLSLGQEFALTTAHERRHLWQAWRVRENVSFPCPPSPPDNSPGTQSRQVGRACSHRASCGEGSANETMSLRIVIGCLVVGASFEALAYWQKLWVYDRSWKRLITLLVVYGLIFGSLSTALVSQSAALRFAAGAFVGIVYEALNISLLRVFSFPNQRLLFLRGPVALSLGAGVCWGLLPLMAPLFRYS